MWRLSFARGTRLTTRRRPVELSRGKGNEPWEMVPDLAGPHPTTEPHDGECVLRVGGVPDHYVPVLDAELRHRVCGPTYLPHGFLILDVRKGRTLPGDRRLLRARLESDLTMSLPSLPKVCLQI